MTQRPILSLKPENKEAAQKFIDTISAEPTLASDTITVDDLSFLGAGSIPKILGIEGVYNSHGSFKPHLSNKLAIGEPRMRDVYWCRFTDAINPEFGKERPVVILSKKSIKGTFSLVVPVTTEDEGQTPENSHKLTKNPNPNGGHPAWVVASHVYTVSHWRMRRFWNNVTRNLVTPRISNEDFERVLEVLHNKIPSLSANMALKPAVQTDISVAGIVETVAK